MGWYDSNHWASEKVHRATDKEPQSQRKDRAPKSVPEHLVLKGFLLPVKCDDYTVLCPQIYGLVLPEKNTRFCRRAETFSRQQH